MRVDPHRDPHRRSHRRSHRRKSPSGVGSGGRGRREGRHPRWAIRASRHRRCGSAIAAAHIPSCNHSRLTGPRSSAPSTSPALADRILGPGRPCPGRRTGASPTLMVLGRGASARWRCPGCRDGGTVLDLVALAHRCGTDEAAADLAQLVAELPGVLGVSGPAVPERRLPPVAVVARTAAGEQELVVDAAASATVGDLATVLFGEAGPLAVDGVVVEAQIAVGASGTREGSVVARPPRPLGSDDWPVVELRWVRGVDAGRIDRLAPGSWLIGTSPQASVCRADAGAPQAAVVEVSTRGEVMVEELVAGAVTFGPTGDSTNSTGRMAAGRRGRGRRSSTGRRARGRLDGAPVRAAAGAMDEAGRPAGRSSASPGGRAGGAPERVAAGEASRSFPVAAPPLARCRCRARCRGPSAAPPDPRRCRCHRDARHVGLATHPARQGPALPAS